MDSNVHSLRDHLSIWIKDQKPSQSTKDVSAFYRNLEKAFDVRRLNYNLLSIVKHSWRVSNAIDFSSNDGLSLGSSGILRTEFLAELARYPEFSPEVESRGQGWRVETTSI